MVQESPQIIELATVVHAFRRWTADLNIVTDSAYVAGLISCLESAYLKEVSNLQLFALMKELLFLLNGRSGKYFVMHVRSHTNIPGPITEGNNQADMVAGPVVVPNKFKQACLSHGSFTRMPEHWLGSSLCPESRHKASLPHARIASSSCQPLL